MGQVKKATRKFESKNLTRILDDRKAKAKTKQGFLLREKKKLKRDLDAAGEDGDNDDDQPAKKAKPEGPQIFEDMSIEDFFAGGFEIPEAATKVEKSKGRKRKQDQELKPTPTPAVTKPATAAAESEDDDDSEAEDDEVSEDELEAHQGTLSGLAEKDPEFFKYLKENDPELLDFSIAERDDLSSVDELSEGEAETGKSKKGKKGANEASEVTKADVKKWTEALVEKKSLRTLRQVVLAFRAAAHVNDVDEDASQGGFKYSITNPDGNSLPPLLFILHTQQNDETHAGTSPSDLYSFHADMAFSTAPLAGSLSD